MGISHQQQRGSINLDSLEAGEGCRGEGITKERRRDLGVLELSRAGAVWRT